MERGVTSNQIINKTSRNMNKKAESQNYIPQKKIKKVTEMKKDPNDTISETISFVIKGQLTPIKPIPIALDKEIKSDKLPDKTRIDITVKTPTKVQTKTAKILSKESPKKAVSKDTTKVLNKKLFKNSSAKLSNAQKVINEVSKENFEVFVSKLDKLVNIDNNKIDVKKKPEPRQKSSEKTEKSSGKTSRDNSKSKTEDDKVDKISKSPEVKNDKANSKPESRSNSAEKGCKKDSTKLDKPKKKLVKSKVMSQEKKEKLLLKAKLLKKSLEMKNKTKQILPKKVMKNKDDKLLEKNLISTKDSKEKTENEKKGFDKKPSTAKEKDIDSSNLEIKNEKLGSKNETKKEKLAKKFADRNLAKIKVNPVVKKKLLTPVSKKELVKKKLLTKKRKFLTKEERRKEKLYKFWNAPKRHRVASLNAIAKVHCLYENESKSLFDKIAEQGMIKRVIKQELIEKDSGVKKKKEIKEIQSVSDETSESEEDEEPCTRTLRCVPGLRGAGKHWDPNALSSDENISDVETSSSKSTPVKRVRVKKEPKEEIEVVKKKRGAQKGKKRIRRPKSPQNIDLKDLVVSKRMASLNASAMLAASYSNDKKTKFSKREDTDTDDSSADEYFAALEQLEPPKKIKLLEEIKVEKIDKDEDRKVIEVHTTPNKKVAVIVNQEADVTITGVYVNSTTRSTHHEGYCSIAGMQYRISATSHTQTAATAVATETVLQGANAAQENPPPEPQRSGSSSQSYAPLDALSNMQPPPGPGIHQQGPPPPPGHHVMPPPGPQMTSPPHHRHHQVAPPPPGCSSSAFSSPHHAPACGAPPGVGPSPGSHSSGDSPYHSGYYQPAGPLIPSAYSHAHVQPTLLPQAPPPPLSKSASLSDTGASSTPSSTTSPMVIPPVGSHMGQAPPPPSSSNGGDSDNEVIITSVTSGTKDLPPSSHSTPISYRAYSHYPPPPPADLRYSAYPPYASYHYPSPAPPPNSYPPSPHHPTHGDLCYPMVYHPAKYGTSYRRYLTTSSQYYQAPPSGTDLYPGQSVPVSAGPPPSGQPSQQVVTVPPSSAAPQYAPSGGPTGPPPPPTIIEQYSTPPTLMETSYPPPPPPHHYYPPGYAIPPPPQCYSHPSNRIPYAHTYQPCPCPMQSCPKNVHTGPLTGDGSKRSNISKDSIPLPPVASLALPLEPASATGPPSPARGSAGMPPPPSPAGAVYQATPPAPKQEARSPEAQECGLEKKRKARVGKAMVRSNMQQNTMLLMCNPSQNCNVKREIESPKDKEEIQKKETILEPQIVPQPMPEPLLDKDEIKDTFSLLKTEVKDDQTVDPTKTNTILTHQTTSESIAKSLDNMTEISANPDVQEKENTDANINPVIPEVEKQSLPLVPNVVEQEPLPPCIKTVAENVKVKNMKRKQSMEEAAAKEQQNNNVPDHNSPPTAKRTRLSSYKNIIKKKRNIISKEQTNNKRMKLNCKNRIVAKKVLKRKIIKNNNNNNTKVTNNGNKGMLKTVEHVKATNKAITKAVDIQKSSSKSVTKGLEKATNCGDKKAIDNVNPNSNGNKTAVKVLDNLIAKNNVDKTIDEVINTIGNVAVVKTKNPKDSKNPEVKEPLTSNPKTSEPKPTTVCKKLGSAKRKSSALKGAEKDSTKAELLTKVPRKSLQGPRWSNGWCWEGEPFEGKVFVNSDDVTCIRKCYPMMRHESGDILAPRDCVLLAGPKKNDLPFVAKIAYLWENPEDGEMMMSLLWYYRPEHTEQGRLPGDQSDEVFASKHKDCNSVACIDDKCYVLTYNEYCRYRRDFRSREEGIEKKSPCIPTSECYPRAARQPEGNVSVENIFFCRKVYDFRQKRMIKNPT